MKSNLFLSSITGRESKDSKMANPQNNLFGQLSGALGGDTGAPNR